MFQLIKQDSMIERKDQELKDKETYYIGLLRQLKDEEAIYKEDILTDT